MRLKALSSPGAVLHHLTHYRTASRVSSSTDLSTLRATLSEHLSSLWLKLRNMGSSRYSPARLMYPHLFRVLYLLVLDEVLSPGYSQVSRRGSNHAANIRRHVDHLKSLAYTSPRSLPIATEDTECNVIFPGCYFYTFQR